MEPPLPDSLILPLDPGKRAGDTTPGVINGQVDDLARLAVTIADIPDTGRDIGIEEPIAQRWIPKKTKAETLMRFSPLLKNSTAANYLWEEYIRARKVSTSIAATSAGILPARWD